MDRSLLKYYCIQVLEKIIRMERLLEQPFTGEEIADVGAIQAFENNIKEIRSALSIAIDNIKYIGDEPDFHLGRTIVKDVNECFMRLDFLHTHLSYVTGLLRVPETKSFIEGLTQDFQDIDYPRSERLSVIFSDLFMFEETDLATYLSGEEAKRDGEARPALFLPKIEAENPLQWSVLVHELGHSVPKKPIEKMITIMKDDVGNDERIIRNWAEELFCDLFSLHLLGPAYLASFSEFITLVGPEGLLEEATETHPYPRMRICIMMRVLEERGITAEFSKSLFGKWNDLGDIYYELFEERCDVERRYFRFSSKGRKIIPIDTLKLRKLLESDVESIIPFDKALPPFDLWKFNILRDRLKKGIPIASYRNQTDKDQLLEEIKDIENKSGNIKGDGIPDELMKRYQVVQNKIVEYPCTIAEIINAGWLYKCEEIYAPLVEQENGIDEESELSFKEKIVALDGLLRVSIETAHMHRLMEAGKKIEDEELFNSK